MIKHIEPKPIIEVFGLNDRLKFGKYAGRSIAYIMGEEPSYIRWLLSENKIRLSSIAYEMYNNLTYKKRYDCESDLL